MLTLISLSSVSRAEMLYKCQFDSFKKNGSLAPWTKIAFLSKNRFSKITFSYDSHTGTTLNVLVSPDETLQGTVNGQYNFILKGNVYVGEFESAYTSGKITCETPKNYEVGFIFKPWGSIFVAGDLSTIISLKSSSDLKNSCYFGNPQRALETVKSAFNLTDNQVTYSKANGDITATFFEKKCTNWTGSSIDDYECLNWSSPTPTQYVLSDCDYDPYP